LKKILVNSTIIIVAAGLISSCNNIGSATSDSNTAAAVSQNQLKLVLSKSVKEWTVCDGVTDDSKGLAKAFAAAKNGAFTLDIDCPLYFHVGMDIASPIFIDNGTSVNFKGSGHRFDFSTTYNGMLQTADIAVYNPEYVSYGNNTLRDILVGKFGLRTYEIKNNTSRTIYGLTFTSTWNLPSYMTYDDTRTTCNLNNQTVLAPNASCNVVFKYQPLIKGVNSYFVLKIYGNDSFYETLSSDNIYVPYSSQY